MKVKLFNRKLNKLYGVYISWISTISSIIFILLDIPEKYKNNTKIFIFYILLLIVVYIILWIYSNRKKHIKLLINETVVKVEEGDIFQSDGLKIIPFNEYFDTVVDEKLITSNSLNGMYLNNYVTDVKALDKAISNDKRLKDLYKLVDKKRIPGKQRKYPLGTIYKNGNYLLMAFSMFDADNRAFLDKSSYLKCLLNMWNEIDIFYGGYDVVIPLLGSGITRFKGVSLSEQELLELLLISLRLSNIKFKSKISVVIHSSKVESINFFKLSDFLK